jgi:hypothetical protein
LWNFALETVFFFMNQVQNFQNLEKVQEERVLRMYTEVSIERGHLTVNQENRFSKKILKFDRLCQLLLVLC